MTITLVAETANVSKTYRVLSVSPSTGGRITTITALLTASSGNYSYFLDNVITSQFDVYFKNKVPVAGWIQSGTMSFKVPDWQPSGA